MCRRLPILIAMSGLTIAPAAMANEYTPVLTEMARTDFARIVADPIVVEAVKAQNAATSGYDQAQIDELDTRWRAEVETDTHPMLDEALARPISVYLENVVQEARGFFTEVFVMDAKGLNVGQSGITSDYWQGDEAKWQETYLVGPNGIFIDDVELDDSTQTYQSQVSIPVVDTDGTPIGAVTFGVNVAEL